MCYRLFFLSCCFNLFAVLPATLHAQLTAADSLFMNSKFNEQLYVIPSANPGDWYVHPAVTSPSNLDTQLQQIFRFPVSAFPSCFSHLSIDTALHYDTLLNATFNYYYNTFGNAFLQTDPLIKLGFELNGITANAYFTHTPSTGSGNHEIAFMILPGSDPNQTTELIQGGGYHNINCFVKNLLVTYGDVFIQCKPLEDYRALSWNEQKFNSSDYNTPGLRYVYDYLDSIDRPYGISILVEAEAMLKYLHTHYKKVVVLGCSMGGYTALLTSLNAPADGALIASGYTKFGETDPTYLFEQTQNFHTLPYQYDSNQVKNKLAHSPCEFLFSWPDLDSYWYQYEHDNHSTQSFLGNLDNCGFYYNYVHHSFPDCGSIDSFIQRILNKPKVFLVADTLHQHGYATGTISFAGQGPYSFTLYRDSIPFLAYNLVSGPLTVILPPGRYVIGDIINGAGVKGTCMDTLQIVDRWCTTAFTNPDTPDALPWQQTVESIAESGAGLFLQGFKGDLSLYGLDGREIVHTRVNAGQLPAAFRGLPTGIYLIRLDDGKRRRVMHYLKQE